MHKKKTTKSKAGKSVKNLPTKKLSAKMARGVKGGASFSYGKVVVEYHPQKS